MARRKFCSALNSFVVHFRQSKLGENPVAWQLCSKSKSVPKEEAGFAAYYMHKKWAIENSHPQVYVSALVFSPARSLIKVF
jgi:hypothetical protein